VVDAPNIHRSLTVLDKKGNVVGKLSQLDLILGLEEGYRRIGDMKKVAHHGYYPKFIRDIIEKNEMWEKPLDEICAKAGRIKVKDIMYTPSRGEYTDADATLDVAIHQLGMGPHHSLLVTEGGKVVGILRLGDIFDTVNEVIRQCNHEPNDAAA
jgi:CBS-domain-containing membrane protein